MRALMVVWAVLVVAVDCGAARVRRWVTVRT